MRERFRSFMQRALYHPERGYYTAHARTVGARGDFSTTATLGNALGKAIARWLKSEAQRSGIRTIIEVGGGDGSLSAAVRKELGWWQLWRWQHYFVETSARLTKQQKERLGGYRCGWFKTLPEALSLCAGRALIYHNELLDAFPVDLVQWDATHSRWRYVELETEGNLVTERLGAEASDPAFSLLHTGTDRLGVRAELHSGLHEWLMEWLPLWQSGSMLSIDYGETLPQLYHRRPRGTLRAYLLHQRIEGAGVYENVGRQDLTADVNFTDVRNWLREAGCAEERFETQTQFLHRWLGQGSALAEADPFGAGSAFKCLTVRR